MKIFRIFLATVLVLSLMGLPVMAAETVNLLPGGSFAEEVFAEDVSENRYNSGATFNNGTWTANFTYNEVANDSGYVLVRKLNADGNQVELRRGASGYGNMTSKTFTLTRGETYTFAFTFRCTSSSGTDATVSIREYSDETCTELVTEYEIYKNTIGNKMTAFAEEFTVAEGIGTEAYVKILFNIGNTRRALQIQDVSLKAGKSGDVGEDNKDEEEEVSPTGNLLPGGAFEEEVFAEDVTINEYTTGSKLNGGTWTCGFTPNTEVANDSGWCKVKKGADGKHIVELRRGSAGATTLTLQNIPVQLGRTYKVAYDIRCTSSSGTSYTFSMPAYEDGTQVTTNVLYAAPAATDTYGLKNTFKHTEHYFTVPEGRKGVSEISFVFSIGNTRRALEIKNISLTYCDEPVTGFTAAAAVERELYTSGQWCKNDSYDSLNVHSVFSAPNTSSAMTAGTEVTLYPTVADVGTEGEGAKTVVFAQYSEDGVLLSIDFLETQTAAADERDYLCRITPKAVTLDANAASYKLFYRNSINSLLIPLKDVTDGTITAPPAA